MDTKIRKFGVAILVVVSLVVSAVQVGTVQGQSPVIVARSSNGRIAFSSNRDGNYEIYTMNPDGSNQTRLTNSSGYNNEPAWSPDGTKIAFGSTRDGGWRIYFMNADGSEQTRLTNIDSDKPVWAPDSQSIVFSGDGEIWVVSVNNSEITRLTNSPATDGYPAWSPDGSRIAFLSHTEEGTELLVINPGGSNQTKLADNAAWANFPTWSPDGKRIAFNARYDGYSKIDVINADGSARLTISERGWCPSWSPDGSKIAFRFNGVSVMNPDGSGAINIAPQAAYWASYWQYAWSPDSRKIAFESFVGDDMEIYVVNVDGTGKTQLTNNTAYDIAPIWGLGETVIPTPTPAPTTQPTVQPTPTQTPQPTVTPGPTATTTPQPTSTPSEEDIRLDVLSLKQDYPDWATDVYNLYRPDQISETIAKWGCATTSAAMVLSYYSGVQVDPKDLDDWLAANSGYTPEHGVIWTRIPWFAWERLGLTLAQPVYAATTLSRLDSALAFENENPPIVNVCWKDCSDTNEARWHWVVVIGKSGSEYLINDPSGWLNRQTLGQYPVWGNMVTYASASGPTAPSLWLYLCSPAEMVVMDSLGRQTGIDPTTGDEFSEIPGAFYGDEFLSPADDSDGATMHAKVLVLPEGGIYTVEVTGTGDGSYTLLAISSGDGGQPLSQSITRSVTPGQVDSYVLDYSPTDGDLELFQNTYLPLVSR